MFRQTPDRERSSCTHPTCIERLTMTPVETRILVSSVDRDFIQRLRDLQHWS